jgi:3-methyl-2-oxobutanoate hydroxymethyltransferase
VSAVARAGIPVWAQFGITPQTALRHGVDYQAMFTADAQLPGSMTDELVRQAQDLEAAGAALLDFSNSGPAAGPAVTRAVSIPVIGGAGGGPWLDGRVRMAHAAIGYAASVLDDKPDTYAHVAQTTLDVLTAVSEDVRSGRHIRGDVCQ